MDGLWATKSEGVGLSVRAIISVQELIHQRHRQTERRTTCNLNTALCTSASRGKNSSISTTPRRFEDVRARNAFEYLRMVYIARN